MRRTRQIPEFPGADVMLSCPGPRNRRRVVLQDIRGSLQPVPDARPAQRRTGEASSYGGPPGSALARIGRSDISVPFSFMPYLLRTGKDQAPRVIVAPRDYRTRAVAPPGIETATAYEGNASWMAAAGRNIALRRRSVLPDHSLFALVVL
jgi:hypothetical protein